MNNKTTKLNKINILTVISLAIFLVVIFYISGIVWIFETILTFIFYCFITFWIYILWKKIRKKDYLSFNNFIFYFLKRVLLWIYISVWIIGWLSYYFNEISPAWIPTYTISNWEKTVIFQAMSHIWSKNFYEKVKQNLIKAKKDWYVYFFEWVKGGNKENMQDFNKAIWIKFDKDLYKNFSKLYWVINQDNSIYYNLVNNLDFNIDLSIDEIMKYYKSSKIKNNKNNLLQNKDVVDVNKEIIKTLSQLNSKELKILRYVNQAMLNFMISSKKTQNLITNNFWNQKLFEVILNQRNKNLAKNIIDSKYKKIYITYWLLHFKWVFSLLQKNDPNWKITKTEYLYPIQ